MKDLNKTHEEQKKNPEDHPMYSDEWKRFWNRRYKELQAGLIYLLNFPQICFTAVARYVPCKCIYTMDQYNQSAMLFPNIYNY